jgi:hypothetical protein
VENLELLAGSQRPASTAPVAPRAPSSAAKSSAALGRNFKSSENNAPNTTSAPRNTKVARSQAGVPPSQPSNPPCTALAKGRASEPLKPRSGAGKPFDQPRLTKPGIPVLAGFAPELALAQATGDSAGTVEKSGAKVP